ncbi:molybdate ABC transporter substrate-binding protein [Micromonospora terminaliae]|uniref:Molybdate ABC transporter substrate-binding protein n=1 Tax=Micromonospora terminaliae TaxID=1914461 RepID=A0AAJ3DHZ9_9ACTN|nr:molybdate ABC transporter substrate-binding protein [Micromonospora terminaliae]QGL48043.1 molybdate ABC transporter substrate-binding protein [Micromonospora terminaliae]
MTARWIRAALAGVAALGLALTGCGGADDEPSAGTGGTVTVFAAASLTESFTKLGKDYEATHPGTRLVFNFAGSAALATQITQGAPADVFAAASPATMKTVTDAGEAAGTPAVLVRNQLVIAVPKGNPDRVVGLADLARPGVKVALCAEQVPCGAAAKTALAAAGVRLAPATLEQDVKGALAKVKLGEVDAALVYRTDVRAAAELDAVEFPESARAVNDYPIVVLKHAGNPDGARGFVDHVRSAAGLAALTAAGFQAPPKQ